MSRKLELVKKSTVVAKSKRMKKKETPAPTPTEIRISEPGSSGETLHQRRLRAFYDLEKEYLEIRRRYEVAYAQLQVAIIKGAEVPDGHYKLRPTLVTRRSVSYKTGLIEAKGKDYQERYLDERGVRHQYLRVRVL